VHGRQASPKRDRLALLSFLAALCLGAFDQGVTQRLS